MGTTDSATRHANDLVGRAQEAARLFKEYDQARVDRIVRAVYEAAYTARMHLARLASAETGMGLYEHKVVKNAWASLLVYDDIRDAKTVGEIHADPVRGIIQIAQPKGPILATVPITNPTSTAIFKALICMKTRNPVIFSAHRGARKCVKETVRILAEAAEAAGAPAHAIQAMTRVHREHLAQVMTHPALAMILATGTASIVKLAQQSGTPTLGVGPGNVPVYVHATADLRLAARSIVHSKTFDNGTVCASEQAVVVERDVAARLQPLLEERGAYFCTGDQAVALGSVCFDMHNMRMRPEAVGQPASALAERAGFAVPKGTRLLIAEPEGVGPEHPLSHELLMPVLSYYRCDSYDEALRVCGSVSHRGGIGHTVGVYANDQRVVDDFARMDAARILVNTPSTQGAIGGIFNSLRPSLSLGCGAGAGNTTTDNISVDHLLNIHRVAKLRPNSRWLGAWATTLDENVGPEEILARYNRNY
jgi:acetaldehyde dehydrogenase/alcohol dehydrogenase